MTCGYSVLGGVYESMNMNNNSFLEVGLETSLLSSRDGPEKVQKQGRDERTQGDYPTSTVYFLQM